MSFVADGRERILFVYGTLLSGQRSHERLGTAAKLGEARTEPVFQLVDLGPYPALVVGGTTAVCDELYQVPAALVRELDVFEQVPILFKRVQIPLERGSLADAYVMDAEKTRGRRRIAHGDWRKRMSVATPAHDGPFARRARGR
jgi:gamma-glutamylaminecyclotransferase